MGDLGWNSHPHLVLGDSYRKRVLDFLAWAKETNGGVKGIKKGVEERVLETK